MQPDIYINDDLGVAATITPTKQGYAVTLIDTDAQEIVGARIYPYGQQIDAHEYARLLVEA